MIHIKKGFQENKMIIFFLKSVIYLVLTWNTDQEFWGFDTIFLMHYFRSKDFCNTTPGLKTSLRLVKRTLAIHQCLEIAFSI